MYAAGFFLAEPRSPVRTCLHLQNTKQHAVTQLLISRTILGLMNGQSQSHVRLCASKLKTWTLSVYSIHVVAYLLLVSMQLIGFTELHAPKLWPYQRRLLASCLAIFNWLTWVNPQIASSCYLAEPTRNHGLAGDWRIFGTFWDLLGDDYHWETRFTPRPGGSLPPLGCSACDSTGILKTKSPEIWNVL